MKKESGSTDINKDELNKKLYNAVKEIFQTFLYLPCIMNSNMRLWDNVQKLKI